MKVPRSLTPRVALSTYPHGQDFVLPSLELSGTFRHSECERLRHAQRARCLASSKVPLLDLADKRRLGLNLK